MELNFNPAGARPAYTPPPKNGAGAALAAAPQPKAPEAPVIQTVSDADLVAAQDAQRKAVVEQAAQAFKDTFVVSDSTFTIFKDTSGQYITRFTSLRDGKVSYYPEQSMFSYFQQISGSGDSLVKIDA